MRIPRVGDKFVVIVHSVKAGKNNEVYVTVSHPLMTNLPTFILATDQQVDDDQKAKAGIMKETHGTTY